MEVELEEIAAFGMTGVSPCAMRARGGFSWTLPAKNPSRVVVPQSSMLPYLSHYLSTLLPSKSMKVIWEDAISQLSMNQIQGLAVSTDTQVRQGIVRKSTESNLSIVC